MTCGLLLCNYKHPKLEPSVNKTKNNNYTFALKGSMYNIIYVCGISLTEVSTTNNIKLSIQITERHLYSIYHV